MLNPGHILQERYEIKCKLGQGGFGIVYEAQDTRLQNVSVAIKETSMQSAGTTQQRFEQEAGLLAKLKHSSLPKVTDYFAEQGNLYLVMEYVPGEDLSDYLKRQPHKRLNQDETLTIITPVLDALDYLHGQDIIHRDIKPGNIRITPDDNVCLVDFGLARVYNPNPLQPTTLVAVTPGFSPYEQYLGEAKPSSDLYALGATLYTMLKGAPPPDALARQKQHVRVDPLCNYNPTVSKDVDTTIKRLLNMNADKRYPSVAALRQDLQKATPQLGPKPKRFAQWVQGLSPLEIVGIVVGIITACIGIMSFATECTSIKCLAEYVRASEPAASAPNPAPAAPSNTKTPAPTTAPAPSQAPPSNASYPVSLDEWRNELDNINETFGQCDGYWCFVPAGTYRIGGWTDVDDDDDNDDEATLDLRGYWVAKYPITVQQYREFINAGGYDNRAWWTDNGWAWKEAYDDGNGRTQPWGWDDADYNSDTQPVIGVTWYEASAFAASLNEGLADMLTNGYQVHLPTEAEWEVACAYDGAGQRHTYPWGQQAPTVDLVDNKNLGGIEAAAPIGGRPDGAAACGAQDMVGSVWEWTTNDYFGYATESNTRGADFATSEWVALRGASWYSSSDVLLCAARYWDYPSGDIHHRLSSGLVPLACAQMFCILCSESCFLHCCFSGGLGACPQSPGVARGLCPLAGGQKYMPAVHEWGPRIHE